MTTTDPRAGTGPATGPDAEPGGDPAGGRAGGGSGTDRRLTVSWTRARWVSHALTLAGLGVLAAAVAGRADLLVFAAPVVGALVAARWAAAPPPSLRARATASTDRVVQGEDMTLVLELLLPPGAELVEGRLETTSRVEADPLTWEPAGLHAWRAVIGLRAAAWGRSPSRVRVRLRGAGGLYHGTAAGPLPSVTAFPVADVLDALPRPADLPDLLGVHVSRRRGAGSEFAGVRDYVPGDPENAVNWRATARYGRLLVTERLAEKAATVVAMVDAADDLAQPGRSTLEDSVAGALSVARAAAHRGDRAGVLALGGTIRWMAPGLGRRHLHRLVEAVTEVRTGHAPTDVAGYPRAVLPPGSVVVVFSPLTDDRVLAAVADLARRGFVTVVVDVLRTAPVPRPDVPYDPLAVRMWRLRRRGLMHRLAEVGVPVLEWPAGVPLEAVLRPVSRRPLVGRRP